GAPHAVGPIRPEVEGQPAFGALGGHLDVLWSEGRHVDRNAITHRVISDLERLPEAGSRSLREWHLVVRAVVHQTVATPHGPADVHDLAGPTDGAVVGDAVEALDHLGPRRSEAEDEP